MPRRERIDLHSPEARQLAREIRRRTFLTEGIMVAFPLCFPGASAPPPPDESRITALDVTPDGAVYGGTSGRRVHLFVGWFHGATGAVFDLGTVEGAHHCPAVCCGERYVVAGVNGPKGGFLLRQRLHWAPFDLIQEWGFGRSPFEEVGPAVPGERILHGLADGRRQEALFLTEGHLVALNLDEGGPRIVGEVPGRGRLALGSQGNIFGFDEGESLWRYEPATGTLTRRAVSLPKGAWADASFWARNPRDGRLFLADGEGRLFAFTEEEGFSPCLGQAPLVPVGPMAVTHDGRLFGACGQGIAQIFRYDPASSELTSLGVAVSVIERRRYGYAFGDAATGRDGEIYFGEEDDGGHLWIYFPAILGR